MPELAERKVGLMKTVEEFIKEIESSDVLKNELKAIKDDSELSEFLKKQGCDAAAAEFKSFVKSKFGGDTEGEIADDDAEAVAGGKWWFW